MLSALLTTQLHSFRIISKTVAMVFMQASGWFELDKLTSYQKSQSNCLFMYDIF